MNGVKNLLTFLFVAAGAFVFLFDASSVRAAEIPACQSVGSGHLIKTEQQAAVYYCSTDGKRYVFPNERVYFSWYQDFLNVTIVSEQAMAASSIGGNVTYPPAKQLVKIQTDPKVYAVGNHKTLRWISSETIAKTLYGPSWASLVRDVSDALFSDYEIGMPILEAYEYNPGWILYADKKIQDLFDATDSDLSDLPSDIPVYPNGNVESLTVTASGASRISFTSSNAREGIAEWYQKKATALGWKSEDGLLESVIYRDAFAGKFSKVEGDRTFNLLIVESEGVFYVSKTEDLLENGDLSSVATSLPVYPNAEIIHAGAFDEDSSGYTALSSASAADIYGWIESRLHQDSWREVDRADQEAQIIRRYERSYGMSLRDIAIFIIPLPENLPVTYIIAVEGPSTMFDEISFDEIAKDFGSGY